MLERRCVKGRMQDRGCCVKRAAATQTEVVAICYQLDSSKAAQAVLRCRAREGDFSLCFSGASAEKAVRLGLEDLKEAGISGRQLALRISSAAIIVEVLRASGAPKLACALVNL